MASTKHSASVSEAAALDTTELPPLVITQLPPFPWLLTKPVADKTAHQPAAGPAVAPTIYFNASTEHAFLAPSTNIARCFVLDAKLIGGRGFTRCDSVGQALMLTFAQNQMAHNLAGAMRDRKSTHAKRCSRLQAYLAENGCEKLWEEHVAQFVGRIVYASFAPRAQLRRAVELLDTGNSRLVFVDDDAILGSGASMGATCSADGRCGLNLLGEALMKVRAGIRKSNPDAKEELERTDRATEGGYW